MFCTNCHKIDITTGYLHLGGNTSIQEKAILEVEFSMLHRHLIFSFVLLVQQTGTIIADDLYICIELVSMATTWINRVRLLNLLVVSCIPRIKYIYICTGTVLLFVLVCIPGKYRAYSRVIWINRVRLPNLLVVSCIPRIKYIYICTGPVLLFVLVCIPGTSIFLFGDMHIRARFTAVYAYMYICVTTAVCVVVVVVVSHIQRIGCQPEKNYFTRWPIPLVVC